MGSVALLAAGIFLLLRHGASEEAAQRAKAERDFALRTAGSPRPLTATVKRCTASMRARRRERTRRAEGLPGGGAGSAQRELYREVEAAAASQDWERARKLLDTLTPVHTYYGEKAAEKASAITAGYVNLHVAAAAMMKGKDNAGCLAEAQLALAANPESADARSLADACKAPP